MKKIEIFDPAMCCPTGICGPSIDPELLRIATVINTLKESGIEVKRHNLASEPQVFVTNNVIREFLQKEGAEALPVTVVDEEIVKMKSYPSNEELSHWLDVNIKTPDNNNCCCNRKNCC